MKLGGSPFSYGLFIEEFTISPNKMKERSGFWYGTEMNQFFSYDWH